MLKRNENTVKLADLCKSFTQTQQKPQKCLVLFLPLGLCEPSVLTPNALNAQYQQIHYGVFPKAPLLLFLYCPYQDQADVTSITKL